MAAVAAPRPDAEPVTITHNPSFDIGIPHCFSAGRLMAAIYHIVRQNTSQIGKTPLRGINAGGLPSSFMPPRQAALRRQPLVMAVAFPHHAVQEKARNGRTRCPERNPPGEMCANRNGERCGGE
jgi:hypothetical protein